jgi:hypothetical protein
MSAKLPITSTRAQSSQRHTGMGAPQKRERETAQSRALASQSPKRPSRTCDGTQLTRRFSSTRRSRYFDTVTNQVVTAR